MTDQPDCKEIPWGELVSEEEDPVLETISTFGNRNQLLFTPLDLEALPDPITEEYLQQLNPVSNEIRKLLNRAAENLQNQVLEILKPETLGLINLQLNKVNYIVISPNSGQADDRLLGFTQQQSPHPLVIALALSDPEEEINEFRFSSTLFHENTHVADPHNLKLDINHYYRLLSRRYRKGIIDPETAVGLEDPTETVTRIFDGVVYGTKYHGPPKWRAHHPQIVESALIDQIKLYEITRQSKMARTSMRTISASIQELPTRTRCPIPPTTRPIWVDSKLERGVTRWAREQAYQAEHDPNRTWNGALAEFRLLQTGQHPDPNPGAIIYPEQPDKFNHQNLIIDTRYLKSADNLARFYQRKKDRLQEMGISPDHPQLLAHLCRKELDHTIKGQENRVTSRAAWLSRHPEWYEQNPDWTPPEEQDEYKQALVNEAAANKK